MTPEELLNILLQTVTFDIRHPAYDKTIEVAKEAKMLMTRRTEDQHEILTGYRIRETDEQKKQRVRLTNTITAAAIAPVYAYVQEIKRVDGITTVIEPENVKDVIGEKFKTYYRGQSFDDYVFDTTLHANEYDPNAWLIFMQKVVDTSLDFYPIYATSEQAIRYELDTFGEVEYLITRYVEDIAGIVGDRWEVRTRESYLLHAAGVEIFMIERVDTDPETYEGFDSVTIKNKMYKYQVFQNPTTEPPVVCLGAYLHSSRMYNEIFAAEAIPLVRDLIRDKGYLDTTKTVHTFPRRASYVKQCTHEDSEYGLCEGGYYQNRAPDGRLIRCVSCGGSGKVTHRGEQDEIHMAMPSTPDELLELSKLTYVEQPDINLPAFLREEVERAKKAVFAAVYNQETVDKTMTVQTATEIKIEYDKIYNKLAPFAAKVAQVKETGYRVAGQYLDTPLEEVQIYYPYDFKLKSVQELIEQYGQAKQNGVSFPVLVSIQNDLLNKQYRNSPRTRARIQAIESHRPWRDKTVEELAMILQSRAETDPDRILYENWHNVVEEIKTGYDNFQLMNRNRQREILRIIAQAYGAETVYRTGSAIDTLFEEE